jgi:hypothetical protein
VEEVERLAACSSGARPVARGTRAGPLERGALVCLVGAVPWTVLHSLWLGSPAAGLADQVALAGAASSTLGLTAIAFAPVRPREHESRAGLAAVSLGLGWALVPWALLAQWLLASTHHRPLGAVTFAGAASAMGLVSVLAARRLVAFGRTERGRAALRLGRALALLGAAAIVVLVSSTVAEREQVRSGLVDVGIAVAAVSSIAVCSAARWPERAPRWAPLVCVGVWAVTLCLVFTQPDVRATVKSAPIIAGVVGLVLR